MKTIFITGASSGIGKATAKYFAEKKWNVVATMRNPKKEKELSKIKNIKLIRLDVTDEKLIKKAIQITLKEFKHIDVLVNNAGYGGFGAFENTTTEKVQEQFNVNVFGTMNVTRLVLPHFRKRKKGTIINISSVSGVLTVPLYSVYHSTKFAVEGFTESLQFELKPFNIRLKLIEPGFIKTHFNDNRDLYKGLKAYESYVKKIENSSNKRQVQGSDPKIVAEVIYKAATDNSDRLRYLVGKNSEYAKLRRIMPQNLWYKLVNKLL